MLHLGNLRFAPADQGEGSAVEASPSSQEALRLSEQVRNARVQGVMDAAAQWENYLTHVTTLKDQMGTGDPQVTEGGNPTAPFAAFAAPYDNA